MQLENKVAVITGGGRGIGKGIAKRFAIEGARVVIGQRDPESGEQTVKEIKEAGGDALYVRTDIAEADQIERLIRTADDWYGRLDILINNAGVTGLDKSIIEMSVEKWKHTIDVNLNSVFLAARAAGRIMVDKGIQGSIINIGSINSYQAQKHAIHYVTTKGAIPLITMAMAVDLSEHGIRVNAIAPGMISTERTGPRLLNESYRKMVQRVVPMGRTGKVEEVAALALFLVSDECKYIQGETILIDGGLMAQLRLE